MNSRPLNPRPVDGPIAEGTVGWASDGGNAMDLGDAPNDGNTLVRVTLFRGRDVTQPLDQTRAQGQEVLCRLSTKVLAIPVYGARVLVVRPDPWGDVPGAYVIIDTIDVAAWKKFGNAVPGDVFIPAGAGQATLGVRANGTVTVKTSSDNTTQGTTIGFSVGVNGLQFSSPWATIQAGQVGPLKAAGIFLKSSWGSAVKIYGMGGLPGVPAALSSIVKITGAWVKGDSSQVLLGPDVPGQRFAPTAVGLSVDPGGVPLFAAFLQALSPFLAALQSCIAPLGANPLQTGVTPGQVAALETATAPLTAAITLSQGIVTSSSVKVALPPGAP